MLAISLNLESVRRPGAANRLGRLRAPCPSVELHVPAAAQWPEVTRYIAGQFRVAHGARIRDFMPRLLTLACQDHFSAAIGVRPAAAQPLFLERYLAQPIEVMLTGSAGHLVARHQVVELGNLVATQRGASQLLFLLLTAMLSRTELEWAVFTATPQVQKSVERLGIELTVLQDADPSRLSAEQLADWGSYYENQPRVVASKISSAMMNLAAHKWYTLILALFEKQIAALAPQLCGDKQSGRAHAVAA